MTISMKFKPERFLSSLWSRKKQSCLINESVDSVKRLLIIQNLKTDNVQHLADTQFQFHRIFTILFHSDLLPKQLKYY